MEKNLLIVFIAVVTLTFAFSNDMSEQHLAEPTDSKLTKDTTDTHSTNKTLKTKPKQVTPQTKNSNDLQKHIHSTEQPSPITTGSPNDILPIEEPLISDIDISMAGDEKNFSDEGYDSDWIADAESEIWASIEEANIHNSEVELIECRETLCKVEIAHNDLQAQSSFMKTLLAQSTNYSGAIQHYEDSIGRPVTRIYRYR